MKELKYVECLKCGTIHYVIGEGKAKAVKKSTDGFSVRNLKCCFKCGSKDNFSNISDMHVAYYGVSDRIPPILLSHEKPKRTTAIKS